MAVFLGYVGRVELRRSSQDSTFTSSVNPSDVNANKNRFSFDFELGTFLTGDQVEISTTDGTLLSFVGTDGWGDATQYPEGMWYLNVDELGGISLYNTFQDAINGESADRVSIDTISRVIPITVKVVNTADRILGQVTSYEFNTERTAVDVTSLSEDFRQQYSALVSGSGRIECFFDYQQLDADPAYRSASNYEVSRYLNELVLRTKNGSQFGAKLYLVGRGGKPYGRLEDADDEVYYEITGIITNVGMSFTADQPIETTIDFITTGKIHFRVTPAASYLLKEDASRLRLEANQDGFIELED